MPSVDSCLRKIVMRNLCFVSLLFLATSGIAEDATGIVFHDANNNGKLDVGDKPLSGIAVSNGREVVKTNDDGRYTISVDDDTIVFVVKPTGYRPPIDENGVSTFHYIHKPGGSPKGLKFPGVDPTGPLPKSINFPLTAVEESKQFDVLFFGDPQPRDQKEIDYMAHDVVEGLIGSDAAFGVTLGDILFDDLALFESFNRTVGRIGIPWYSVIGNHDINYATDKDVSIGPQHQAVGLHRKRPKVCATGPTGRSHDAHSISEVVRVVAAKTRTPVSHSGNS